MLTVPTLSQELVQPANPEGSLYKLNPRYDPAVKNIKGEPEANRPGDAFREAYTAFLFAKLGASEVWLGDDAKKMLYPPDGRKAAGEVDCDVVARITKGGRPGFMVGDGKGKGIKHALKTQLPKAAKLLKKHHGTEVVGGLIVGRLPAYLYPASQDVGGVRSGNTSWLHSQGDAVTLGRLRDGLANLMPPLNPQMYYLLEPDLYDEQFLPLWAISKSVPHILYTHTIGERRGPLRKHFLPGTQATVELVIV